MNCIAFADFHIFVKHDDVKKYKYAIKEQIKSNYDLVLIAGDVFEHSAPKHINVLEELNYLFDKKPVVFCLGNHEFAHEHYQTVLNEYKRMKSEARLDNICCLDIDNFYDIQNTNYRVIGNVLWYDFSMNGCNALTKDEILSSWLDSTIKDFDPIEQCNICKENIKKSIESNKKHILVTHCVPHIDLNSFSKDTPYSPYNAYSGVIDFLKELNNVEYAICGHTHRRETKEIHGIKCVNVGNDYFFKTGRINYFEFEL